MLNDFNVLSLACTYQIVESIIFMILSLVLIRAHYKEIGAHIRKGPENALIPVRATDNMPAMEKILSLAKIVPLLPSGVFLVGAFLGETYLFNVIDHMRFYVLALLFSSSIAVVLFANAIALRRLFSGWEWRMELKIVLSFFQIIVAMFLPLLLMGLKIHGTQLQVEIKTTMISLASLAFVILAGLFCHLRKQSRLQI
ncbi:MAG: hypothetical protein K8S27_03100 [Candidatus Omnitrophica bacterium]|nr:hypothetical protein [Candidatus Omnitrophota bacterium]